MTVRWVRSPGASSTIRGRPSGPSAATAELVVPKSMPILIPPSGRARSPLHRPPDHDHDHDLSSGWSGVAASSDLDLGPRTLGRRTSDLGPRTSDLGPRT